jgi:hypothetical protein
LLTAKGSPIKHSKEILKLLKEALLPKQIAVIHCPGYQRSEGQVAKGNQRADMAAKEAARIGDLMFRPLSCGEQSLLLNAPNTHLPRSHRLQREVIA